MWTLAVVVVVVAAPPPPPPNNGDNKNDGARAGAGGASHTLNSKNALSSDGSETVMDVCVVLEGVSTATSASLLLVKPAGQPYC